MRLKMGNDYVCYYFVQKIQIVQIKIIFNGVLIQSTGSIFLLIAIGSFWK